MTARLRFPRKARGAVAVAAIALATCTGVQPASAAPWSGVAPAAFRSLSTSSAPTPPAGWTTTFSDTFDGAANSPLDDDWIYDTGTGYPGGAGNWGTGEVETSTNSTANVYQDGAGHLVIKPIRDAQGNWTSGRIETARTDFAAPAGGQVELTATLQQPNPANGLGYWPAFWAMGGAARGVGATNWPSIGEMDIMENVNALSHVSHTFHCGVWNGGPCNETDGISSGLLPCSGCLTAMHTYSVIIDRTDPAAEQLRFYTDDALDYTVNQNQVPADTWTAAVDHGFFMILDVAIGGQYPQKVCNCTQPTASTTSGAPMIVDSVSVYTKPSAGTVATPTLTPAGGTFTGSQQVTIADATDGAAIHYTVDGTTPTASSPVYTDALTVNATTVVKAIATKVGMGSSDVVSATYRICATACAAVPDFGPNVHIFDPSMSSASIQNELDSQFAALKDTQTAQFSNQRVADLYMPGTYNVRDDVPYYTSVAGLGQNPDDVTINGNVTVDAFNASDQGQALQNFWRSAENLSINPSGGADRWAVAQAAPFRRIDVHGDLQLYPASYGYASGGYIADSKVSGQVSTASQQQWYTRDSTFGSWNGGVWNMVFSGTNGAPANTFPNPPETTLAKTPVSRDVPYLYVDSNKDFRVFLPALRTDASGPSWAGGSTPGTSLPISRFYIVKEGDTATTINAALAAGNNLLVTPGIYHLDKTIQITNPDTVVLGIGYPTFIPDGGVDAMHVADVDGVRLKGLLFDAGTTNSDTLLTVGTADSSASHASDPTTIQDVFFRIGGSVAGKATNSLVVNSDDTLIDHIWAWRADHGNAGTVGWNVNTADTGLIVNGDNVLATGLFVEHYRKYQVIWNGENGKTIFFQNEMPYDSPDQASWSHDGVNGYAAYKVADTVKTHEAWGLGSYIYTNVNPDLHAANAFEVPDTPKVLMHDLLTVSLNKAGTIDHVINGVGDPVTPTHAGPTNVVSYPVTATVATPTFTPPAGNYAQPQSVTITSATAGAKIYYTTDGSTPTAASTLFTGPVNVATSETINAIATKDGVADSPIGSAAYVIGDPHAADYKQSVSQLSATQAQISFAPTIPAAFVDIHYVVNGGPQQNLRMTNTAGTWTQGVNGLTAGSMVTYWFTYEKSGQQFDTIQFTYTQGGASGAVAMPTFTPAGGSYPSAQSVTITDATAGASIHYTTDGSAPTTSSTVYTGPINVAASTTIKAIAVKEGLSDSPVASAAYVIGDVTSADFAQTATQLAATQAQISFTPTTPAAYVDIHYVVNGGPQQSLRMTNDAGTWTQVVSALATGSVVTYWFTYEKSGAQYDSAHFTYTQGSTPTPTSASVTGVAGATVPATLSLTLGGPASFGALQSGVARDYTAQTTANVISTAGDATLSASGPVYLRNGASTLASPVAIAFSKASWSAEVANDPVTITFGQHIGANDPLRTGTYSAPVTFTLATTNP